MCSIPVNEARTLYTWGAWKLPTFLTLQKSGTGNGTVSSTPSGISLRDDLLRVLSVGHSGDLDSPGGFHFHIFGLVGRRMFRDRHLRGRHEWGRNGWCDLCLRTYSISGTVMTSSGSPLVGATLNLTGAATAATTTNANGTYSFTGLSNGVYTVTAAKNNYTFSPGSISLNIYSADKTGQNFTGTVQASGSVAVSISPQGAVDAGAQWKVDTGNWQSSGATVSGLTAGAHTLSFKDVTGWNTCCRQNNLHRRRSDGLRERRVRAADRVARGNHYSLRRYFRGAG